MSLTPDVEPPDDESSVRTEPFRPADDAEVSLLSGRFETPGPVERTPEEAGVAQTSVPPAAVDGVVAEAVPAAPVVAEAVAAAPVVAEAVVAEQGAVPSPPNHPPGPTSLTPAFEEKEEWFLQTGQPAQSRDVAPEVAAEPVVVATPNPQVYVFALLVAVGIGVALLLVVYALFA